VDIEFTLVSKAITTGDLEELIIKDIQPEHFADEYIADVYEFSCNFYRIHKSTPSMAAVKGEFPKFKPQLSTDPLSYHIDKFINEVRYRKAVELGRGYYELIDDPRAIHEIEVHAMEMARELAEIVPAPEAVRLSDGKKRREEYYRRKREGIDHGIKLGIPSFDDITLGAQPHEIVIFGAEPGIGKTTALIYVTISAYLQNKTVLFVSLEVEGEQLVRKMDTMLAETKIRYQALKSLSLSKEEEEAWDKILERAESERLVHDVIVRADIKNCSVEKVAAEQMRYKPDVVVVDYLEEMKPKRGIQGWESVAENGRGLKQSARTTKTPHFTATQVARQSGETAYQSTEKIADMLILLRPQDQLNEMQLFLRKYRDGPSRKEVMMRWDLERMEIREKNYAERFPIKNNKALMGDQRRLEQKLEVSAIVGGRSNPFSAKRRNGHQNGRQNPWSRRNNGHVSKVR